MDSAAALGAVDRTLLRELDARGKIDRLSSIAQHSSAQLSIALA